MRGLCDLNNNDQLCQIKREFARGRLGPEREFTPPGQERQGFLDDTSQDRNIRGLVELSPTEVRTLRANGHKKSGWRHGSGFYKLEKGVHPFIHESVVFEINNRVRNPHCNQHAKKVGVWTIPHYCRVVCGRCPITGRFAVGGCDIPGQERWRRPEYSQDSQPPRLELDAEWWDLQPSEPNGRHSLVVQS